MQINPSALVADIEKNNFGTEDSLTVNNMYTCLSDGYLSIKSGNNAGEYTYVLIYGATSLTPYTDTILRTVATNSPLFNALYLKKGMRIYPVNISGNGKVGFIPFV